MRSLLGERADRQYEVCVGVQTRRSSTYRAIPSCVTRQTYRIGTFAIVLPSSLNSCLSTGGYLCLSNNCPGGSADDVGDKGKSTEGDLFATCFPPPHLMKNEELEKQRCCQQLQLRVWWWMYRNSEDYCCYACQLIIIDTRHVRKQ